jgi:FkbM family methyltransferase
MSLDNNVLHHKPPLLGALIRLSRKLPRRLGGYVRAIATRTLSGPDLRIDTKWGTLFATRSDHIYLKPIFDEVVETEIIEQLVQPGQTFVDVGANRGWYTQIALACGAHQVIAVEPDPDARRSLECMIEDKRTDRVTVVPKACAAESGVLRFVRDGSAALSHLEREGESGDDVEADTVDNIVADGPVHIVKIDVEGAEAGVLRGMAGTLAERRPIVMVEVEPVLMASYDSCLADVSHLFGEAYRCSWICWDHAALEPIDAHCEAGRNLLCAPTDVDLDSLLALTPPGG